MEDLPPTKEKNKLKSWGLGILFGKLNLGGGGMRTRGEEVFSFKITTEDQDLSTELSVPVIPVILYPPPFAINRSDWAPVRLPNE